MRRLLILLLLLYIMIVPVSAMEFTAPQIPPSADQYMPDHTEDFGEGVWIVIQNAIRTVKPGIAEVSGTCLSLIAAAMLTGIMNHFSGAEDTKVSFICTVIVGVILLQPVNSLIRLGTQTIQEISQYGKLLLPVMTAALAAQGSVTKSGALYTATAVFDSVMSSAICKLLIPLIYFFICIAVACSVTDHPLLKEIRKFLRWLPTWALKIILYVFTGYISITGVVAGTTDAAMLKATKLTISGMVPVVGNILSDASEAVLVSAGLINHSVGIYGLLAIIAIWIGPFVEIGIQYILLKITTGICGIFAPKQTTELMTDFSTAMGLLLAMSGAVCMMFLISTICFMKGVA